jgi:hypothetical protein
MCSTDVALEAIKSLLTSNKQSRMVVALVQRDTQFFSL